MLFNAVSTLYLYRHMSERMGTPFLQKTLNKELALHIKTKLPSIRNKLRQQMKEIKKDLGDMTQEYDSEWKRKSMSR